MVDTFRLGQVPVSQETEDAISVSHRRELDAVKNRFMFKRRMTHAYYR